MGLFSSGGTYMVTDINRIGFVSGFFDLEQ